MAFKMMSMKEFSIIKSNDTINTKSKESGLKMTFVNK